MEDGSTVRDSHQNLTVTLMNCTERAVAVMLSVLMFAPRAPAQDSPAPRAIDPASKVHLDGSAPAPDAPKPTWLESLYRGLPNTPEWADPATNSFQPGLGGRDTASAFLRDGKTGWTGAAGAEAKALGEAEKSIADGVARRARVFGIFNTGLDWSRIAGAYAGDDPEGKTQETANWLLSNLAAGVGARQGGLLGISLGIRTGNPWGVLIGGVVGTAGGAILGSFAYDATAGRVINYAADYSAALRGNGKFAELFEKCAGMIDSAERLLTTNRPQDAGPLAERAMEAIETTRATMAQVGREAEVDQWKSRATVVLVRLEQLAVSKEPPSDPQNDDPLNRRRTPASDRLEAVEQATIALTMGRDLAAHYKYRDAATIVMRGLKWEQVLGDAGRSDLVAALKNLYAEIRPHLDDSDKPHIRRLAGAGPWHSSEARLDGTITLDIDVERQSFSATFHAERRGDYGLIIYHGTFNGRFTGDGLTGSLDADAPIQLQIRGYDGKNSVSSSNYHVGGRLLNNLVTGTATHNRDSFPFKIMVQ